MAALSTRQEAVLAFLPLFPGVLSIISSSLLIRLCVKRAVKSSSSSTERGGCCGGYCGGCCSRLPSSPFRRILLVMSAFDLLNTIHVCLTPFIMPRESSDNFWVVGNDATCTLRAVMDQWVFPSFAYYVALSFYYLLRIRYSVKDSFFGKRIEPWIHAFMFLYPLTTTIVGLSLGVFGYQPAINVCWVVPNDRCDQRCLQIIIWLFGGIFFVSSFFIVILNNLLIYCYVRTARNKSQRLSTLSTNENASRINVVAVQAFLYVLVFLLTYTWSLILRFMVVVRSTANPYPVQILRALFLPLMGAGNLLVYVRPRYLQVRTIEPGRSRLSAFVLVVLHDSDRRKSSRSSRSLRRSNSRAHGGSGRINNSEESNGSCNASFLARLMQSSSSAGNDGSSRIVTSHNSSSGHHRSSTALDHGTDTPLAEVACGAIDAGTT
eukprot:CAMPEP_0178568290 /NCGR_PEP_ID=MMETSP0697-20121206/15814_1 /TAXON_ID=265572 /ORGANISM="Extubocellulus spinifer, Strain CCMP396" /LENGTH=434 /DNA_ID=CAMNT_0020202349 /DNA_START=261 /DNA_END=1565 /DNA_ORIENTATION=-